MLFQFTRHIHRQSGNNTVCIVWTAEQSVTVNNDQNCNDVCDVCTVVEVTVKSRKVIVRGPRGTLRRDFRHMSVDIKKISKKQLLVEKWFGIRKELAAVKTVCSHIENMMKGVTKVRECRLFISVS